jgi:4-amino-4-deoxy-L-arabinose transferase-like glycosyltransferase
MLSAATDARDVAGDPSSGVRTVGKRVSLVWIGLLLATLALRLPGLERPLLGNFSSKSVLYGMIARNWARDLTPAWDPRVDCLCGGERGLHLIEFPVAAYVAAAAWRCVGGSLDVWGRLTTILFSLASVGLMYALVRRWHGRTAALAASWTLALSPVSIIYGQSFMLEPSLVCFTLATWLALDGWLQGGRTWKLALAAGAFALLLLTKIYMLVLLLPLAVLVRRRANQGQPGRLAPLIAATVLAMAPALSWYGYAWHTGRIDGPRAANIFFSLHTSARTHALGHPLLATPDFYRRLFDDLAGPALTPLGFGLALVGLMNAAWKRHATWLGSMALLVAVLPLKFYEMNYYDLVVLPPLCVLAGLGWQLLHDRIRPGRIAIAGTLLIGLLCGLRYAVVPAFVTPREDRAVLAAAAAVRAHVPAGSPVATLHGTNFDLLYYCDRGGWALVVDDPRFAERLDQCRRSGARWLVVANLDSIERHPAAEAALSGLAVVERGDDFCIYRLEP